MAEVKLRPALATDLHQIVMLDIIANAQRKSHLGNNDMALNVLL